MWTKQTQSWNKNVFQEVNICETNSLQVYSSLPKTGSMNKATYVCHRTCIVCSTQQPGSGSSDQRTWRFAVENQRRRRKRLLQNDVPHRRLHKYTASVNKLPHWQQSLFAGFVSNSIFHKQTNRQRNKRTDARNRIWCILALKCDI